MIYLDGSVLVTHGGVEMGQGLHIKTLQVRALYQRCLFIITNKSIYDVTPYLSL